MTGRLFVVCATLPMTRGGARDTDYLPVISVRRAAWIVNLNCQSVISLRILLGTG